MGFSAWILRGVYLHHKVLRVFCSISSFSPKDAPAPRCRGSSDRWQSCVRKMWWRHQRPGHGWAGCSLRASMFSGGTSHLPAEPFLHGTRSLHCPDHRVQITEDHAHPKPDSCLLWGKDGAARRPAGLTCPGGGWWTVAGQGRAGKQSSVLMRGRRRTRNHSLGGKTERRVAELVEEPTSRRHGRPQALKQML